MKCNKPKLMSFLLVFCTLACAALINACSSLPFDSASDSSWATENREETKGSIKIISVLVERPGEWGSMEKEIRMLLPLLFFEEAYLVVSPDEEADYSADVTIREREYLSGWQTRRSLSAEVRIWEGETSGPLPLSAGRSLIQGKQSFASSKTLSSMLTQAVKNAGNGLPVIRSDDTAEEQ